MTEGSFFRAAWDGGGETDDPGRGGVNGGTGRGAGAAPDGRGGIAVGAGRGGAVVDSGGAAAWAGGFSPPEAGGSRLLSRCSIANLIRSMYATAYGLCGSVCIASWTRRTAPS